MKVLGIVTYFAAGLVLFVCVGLVYFHQSNSQSLILGYRSWLDPFLLYCAATGVFCAVALILLYHIYRELASRNR
jgi:hypothetical protein